MRPPSLPALLLGLLPLASAGSFEKVVRASSGFSGDITKCPGYDVTSTKPTATGGLLITLSLAGEACNAFGTDISDLTVSVEHETTTRLKVHIYDTAQKQWPLPDAIWPRGKADYCEAAESELQFNSESKPFAFWITRKGSNEVLFDTRAANIPVYKSPISSWETGNSTTAMPAYPLVFEDQYLQLQSAMVKDANVYGIGETISISGFRRNEKNTTQAMWARDVGDPLNANEYGIHTFYLEHRTPKAHGAFLLNSDGMDVILREGVLQYRAIGGTLEMYFFAGPSPLEVIEQYVQFIGPPQMHQLWTYGYHQCRWGYNNLTFLREVWQNFSAHDIPLETIWNDIDYMNFFRNFEPSPQRFPLPEYTDLINEIHAAGQHYIPIIDNGIHIVDPNNKSDVYAPYTSGHALDVFKHNPDGSEYIGHVWPGYTVFPNWLAEYATEWWTDAFKNFSKIVPFDGIWLDMNEPSSFCDGSCGTGQNLSSIIPTQGAVVTTWPEGYDTSIGGTSGNMTVDGKSTYNPSIPAPPQARRSLLDDLDLGERSGTPLAGVVEDELLGRAAWAEDDNMQFESSLERRTVSDPLTDYDIDYPPYWIHNGGAGPDGQLPLLHSTVAPNATNTWGGPGKGETVMEYDIHNLNGYLEEEATNAAIAAVHPGERPFIVARSTFAGAGRKTAHWLGDNYSTFFSMWTSLQGILQFQMFGVPMVGADTCGFNSNTDEELCNRWLQLAALAYPFFRNHNTLDAHPQEPYTWHSTTVTARKALRVRYKLLPYLYSTMAWASLKGTPAVRALFWEFPEESSLLDTDRQIFLGDSILVTPVLIPNVTEVKGVFPGSPDTVYRDWYTHEPVHATSTTDNITLSAPLTHLNVHIRDNSAILIYVGDALTIKELATHPYQLIVSLTKDGNAVGASYHDDGVHLDAPYTIVDYKACDGKLTGSVSLFGHGYHIPTPLKDLIALGVTKKPTTVRVNGKTVSGWTYDASLQELTVEIDVDLNSAWEVTW